MYYAPSYIDRICRYLCGEHIDNKNNINDELKYRIRRLYIYRFQIYN